MSITQADTKKVLLFVVAAIILFLVLWAGDEYDIPGLKQAHDVVNG